MRCRAAFLCTCLLALACSVSAHAQTDDGPMSHAEVEKLRDAAYVPVDRINTFVAILDTRANRIQELVSKPRRPGREQQLHDLLRQFGDIAGELNDNLDDLTGKHRDVLKALPKLIEATDRWATTLRAPADNAAYRVVQRIALDALEDLHTAAVQARSDQVAYFKAHPDAARSEAERANPNALPAPIEIPR